MAAQPRYGEGHESPLRVGAVVAVDRFGVFDPVEPSLIPVVSHGPAAAQHRSVRQAILTAPLLVTGEGRGFAVEVEGPRSSTSARSCRAGVADGYAAEEPAAVVVDKST